MPVAGLAGAHRAIDAALGINDGNSSSGKHNHQLCLSLLPLFSFSDANHVLHQDWLRGCKALRLYEMADDKELWQQLLDTYGNASHSAIELAKISFLVPMEPHISLLFRAMVDGLSRIVDVATGQQNKEAKRRDIMANRTILRVRRTILEPPLKAWQAFVISERSMRKRIAKFSRRILNRDCSRAFNQWLAARFGGDRHVDYGQLRGFINRLKNQGLVKSIGTWRAQAERRRGLRAVIVRMKLVHVVKAMNRWQAVARSTAERREYLRGCLAAMSPEGRAKRKAFNEWMPLALARRRLRSSALSLAHRYIRAALNTWVAAAMERAEQLYAVHCAVVSMRNRGARAALNAWISYGEEMHEEKRRLRAALGSFRGDGVRKAYNTWIGLSRARRRMITALGRLTLRSSYRAFARWRDNASQPTRGASRIVATWRADGQMVRKAWNTWLECVEVAWSMRRAVSAISRRGEYKAFSTWAVAVMGRTKRLQAMGGSLASMRNRGIRLALNAWMELAESAANDRRRLLSASKAFTGDVSRKAWYSWLEMTTLQHELARQREGMRSSLKRFIMQSQSRAFESWCMLAKEAAAKQAKMRSCLATLSPEGRAMRKAFNSWGEAAAMLRNLQRAASSLVHRYTRLGWNGWVEFADEQAQRQKAMSKAVASMSQRGERAALNSWVAFAEAAGEQRRLLKSAGAAFKGDGARKAWNQWVHVAASNLTMQRAGLALCNRLQRLSFNSWSQMALLRGQQLQSMRKAVVSLANRELRGSLNSWLGWLEAATEDRRRQKGAAASMMQRGLRQGYNSWNYVWKERKALLKAASFLVRRAERLSFDKWATNSAALGQEHKQRAQAMKRALTSMCNRGIRLALNAWMELAESAANDRRRLLSASKAFTGDVSRKAWYSWLEMTTLQHELARQREGMRSSLKRFIMQSQSRAFESWCMLAKEAAAKQAKMRSCLATLSPEGRAMRKAFNSWGEAAAMLRNLQRAASSLVHRYTRLGWNGWVEFADEQAQRQKAMSKAVASMSQRGERAALNSWVAFAEAAGEQRRLLKSAGAAFKGDGARKAWNQWVHVAAAQSHSRRLAMQAAGRLIHAPMARALLTWQAVVVERSRALDLIAKSSKFFADGTGRAWNQWCSLMASWYRLRRFARRLLRRDLVRAWGQWEESADARRRLQQLSKRALNSDIYHAWLQWSTSLLDMSRMRRFASRLLRRGLAKTFDTWLEQVDAIHQVRKRMKPIARRMLLRGLGAALNKWLDVSSKGRRLRAIGRRMMNSGLVRCLNRWSLAAYESARSLRLLKRVASRVASRVKVRVFEAWARATDETKAERETKQRRALNMMRNRGLAAAFYGWIAATKDAAKLRHKYLARWFHALTIKCYLAWSKWARQEVDTRARMRAIAIRIARRTEVIVLQEWHRYVAYAREQLAIAARRWRQAGVWRCFEHLRDHAERQARLKRLASRLLSGVLNGLQLRMFYAWKGQVESQVQRREQTLLHSIQRMRFGALSIAMDQWRQLVMDARRQHHEAEMQAAALLASKQTRAGSESAPGAESAALKAEVAELRRSLDLTRRELKAVSFASAKRYELAIVRAELLTRPPAGSVKESDEKEDEESTTFPSIHASLWRYAAPFVPDEVQERLLKAATLPPPKQTPVSLTEIPPQSSFLRRLNDEAPLTFRPPSPNEPPPGVPAPPTPKAHITRPSPRAQRMVQASTSAPQAVGLKSAKSKEDIVTEVTLRNMQYHAERVGIHGMAACPPA